MSLLKNLLVSGGLRPILIAFGFESNSGGQALDSDATSFELATNPNVRIWNPLASEFQDMTVGGVGKNINQDHYNLPANRHGWHLELGARMRAGTFVDAPLYLVEFGQGGSIAAEWTPGSNYRNKLTTRYNGAIAGIVAETGAEPDVFMFNSWGINDMIANTSAASFHASYLALLDYIDGLYPVRAFLVDKIFASAGAAPYRFYADQMAALRSNIFVQDMQGKQQMDSFHLGYAGMKAMTDEKIGVIRGLL